jgi:exosortase
MKTSVLASAIEPSEVTQTSLAGHVISAVFLGLLWLQVIHHLQNEWSFNPQYGYGWIVPLLVLFLLWKRWPNRPVATISGGRTVAAAFITLCVVLLFPVRFVAEANPDWRLLSWILALSAVVISFCYLFLAGGSSWARYFTFPLVFFLVAVPWPTFVEQAIVQNLMRTVATINVMGLNLAGIPALQHGNVIEIRSGLIGVEEACSGVRSLQATLMISLFLGEFYMLTIARRVTLIALGVVLAFVCNLVRSGILVWVAATQGLNRVSAWHDPAGLSIFAICLIGLWLISLRMKRTDDEAKSVAPDRKSDAAGYPAPALMLTLLGLLAAGELMTQIWYRAHQAPLENSAWKVQVPTGQESEPIPIAPEALALLQSDESAGRRWADSGGHQWLMYSFRWYPGRTAALFIKTHRPDICLPASGLSMVRKTAIQLRNVNGVNIPVRSYRFDANGVPLHVLYCYWDARSSFESSEAANEEDWTISGRVRAALQGRREAGAQMLELVVWGYENDAEAEAALTEQLGKIVARG